MKKLNLIGLKCGKLTVIGESSEKNPSGKTKWLCLCECGNIKPINTCFLRNQSIISCGCMHPSKKEYGPKMHVEHKNSYYTWGNVIQRCTNPKHPRYKDYGGRGITVCERWLKFENFLEDMGDREKELTIDRIDNNGNYEPGNCEWVTRAVNNENKRCKNGYSCNSG